MKQLFPEWSKSTKIFGAIAFVIVFCVSMFILFSGFANPPGDTSKPVFINWSADRKLKVDDYTVVTHPLKDDAAASSCTGIVMEWQKDLNRYLARAVFDVKQSKWNVYKIKRPDWTLNHEQGHFDIVQYVVTKLNIKLLEDTTKLQAVRDYDEHVLLMNMLQGKYDYETNHSQDSTMQSKWDKLINDLPKKVINKKLN